MTTLDTREMVAFTVGEAPGLTLIHDYLYPLAATYYGNVEECTFTFSLLPDQIPGTDWFRDQIINAFEDKVVEQGAHMIKLQVYEDETPLWHTDYKVIATATASPVPWLLIVAAVLVILFIVALTFLIIQIRTFLWGTPGDGNGGLLTDGLGSMILMLVVMMMMNMIMGFMKEPRKVERITEAGKKVYEVGEKAFRVYKELKEE